MRIWGGQKKKKKTLCWGGLQIYFPLRPILSTGITAKVYKLNQQIIGCDQTAWEGPPLQQSFPRHSKIAWLGASGCSTPNCSIQEAAIHMVAAHFSGREHTQAIPSAVQIAKKIPPFKLRLSTVPPHSGKALCYLPDAPVWAISRPREIARLIRTIEWL